MEVDFTVWISSLFSSLIFCCTLAQIKTRCFINSLADRSPIQVLDSASLLADIAIISAFWEPDFKVISQFLNQGFVKDDSKEAWIVVYDASSPDTADKWVLIQTQVILNRLLVAIASMNIDRRRDLICINTQTFVVSVAAVTVEISPVLIRLAESRKFLRFSQQLLDLRRCSEPFWNRYTLLFVELQRRCVTSQVVQCYRWMHSQI